MSNAFKCDLTGKLYEGDGIDRLFVDVSPNLRLEIVPHNKTAEKSYGHGRIGPEAEARIRKALAAEFPVAPDKKDK